MSTKQRTYPNDKKQEREIESARQYNINWIAKRRDLLTKNYQEMMDTYHPYIAKAQKLLSGRSQNGVLNRYIFKKIKAIQDIPVYGDIAQLMAKKPNDRLSVKAKKNMEKYPFLSPTEALHFPGSDESGLMGQYHPSWFSSYVYIRPTFGGQPVSGTAAHELWHVGTNAASGNPYDGKTYKDDPSHFATVKYLKQDPYIQNLLKEKKLNWDKEVSNIRTNFDNYLWTPDEVLARRASLMHFLNWNPNRKATLKDVQEWRRKGLLNNNSIRVKNGSTFSTTPRVNLEKLSDETILHLINDVALNKTMSKPKQIQDVYYAYKGGLITKLTK